MNKISLIVLLTLSGMFDGWKNQKANDSFLGNNLPTERFESDSTLALKPKLCLENQEGSSIDRTFLLNFKGEKCCSFSISGNGIDVLKITNKAQEAQVLVRIRIKEAILSAFDTDTNENIMNVYFCQDTTGAIHYSSLSMDSARKEAGLDSLSLYSGISGISSNKNIIISGPVQLAKSFACDFSWMDSKGKAFALSGAKVIIKTNSGKSLKKVTNDNGLAYFEFIQDDKMLGRGKEYLSSMWSEIQNGNYKVYVLLDNDLVQAIDGKGKPYMVQIPNTYTKGDTGKNRKYCFSPVYDSNIGSDFGQMVEIFEAIHYYSLHANALDKGSGRITKCKVMYPCNRSNDCYVNDTQTIYIGNYSANNITRKSYEAWDSFGHEYGHHLENIFGISNPISESHNSSKNDCVKLFNLYSGDYAKAYGLRLAWQESWPTFWSTVAQASFPNNLKEEKYLSIGDDCYYSSNLGYDKTTKEEIYDSLNPEFENGAWNYDFQIEKGHAGDGCELSIMRFLYQLWDKENEGSDKFSISEQDLWDFTVSLAQNCLKDSEQDKFSHDDDEKTAKRLNYFSQFLSALENRYGFNDVAKLAECYQLCPSLPRIVKDQSGYSLKWKVDNPGEDGTFGDIRYNSFRIKAYKRADSEEFIALNDGEGISSKKIDKNETEYEWPISDADVAILSSLNGAGYLSVTWSYYPVETAYYKCLGPVEGPRVGISL